MPDRSSPTQLIRNLTQRVDELLRISTEYRAVSSNKIERLERDLADSRKAEDQLLVLSSEQTAKNALSRNGVGISKNFRTASASDGG